MANPPNNDGSLCPLLGGDRQEAFPITRSKVFMAHAAASPMPGAVCRAIQRHCAANASEGQWAYLYADIERETRERAARLFGCAAAEVAFVGCTSMGLGMIAAGLPWAEGDNVVIVHGDFPSNVYPWLALADRGVEVRWLHPAADGGFGVDDLAAIADRRTALVAISSVNYATGCRADLAALGAFVHDRLNAWFCVDAIQSLGALPFDGAGVDFAVAGGHKWLLGPMGTGLMYVSERVWERFSPPLLGWHSVQDAHNYLDYAADPAPGAQRYEPGSPNVIGNVGLHAALGLLEAAGIDRIAAHLMALRERLIEGALALDYGLIGPRDPAVGSPIVTITHPSRDLAAIRRGLDERGIVVSLRGTMDGRPGIRFSPHFYNTDDDVDRALANLREVTP